MLLYIDGWNFENGMQCVWKSIWSMWFTIQKNMMHVYFHTKVSWFYLIPFFFSIFFETLKICVYFLRLISNNFATIRCNSQFNYKYKSLNYKIDNWSFSEFLIKPFDWLTINLIWFHTLASKVCFEYYNF